MQHDERYWQNAEAFRPERWIGDKTGGDRSGGLAYMPFGVGPRMCIGIKLACKPSMSCSAQLVMLRCAIFCTAALCQWCGEPQKQCTRMCLMVFVPFLSHVFWAGVMHFWYMSSS